MIKEKKLILFDMDGTLVDSVPDLAISINDMLVELDRDRATQDDIRGWVGNGALVLVKRALAGCRDIDEIEESLALEGLDIFLRYYTQNLSALTRPYPTVVETLIALKARGYKMAIVTNKPYRFIEPILKIWEIDGIFELYIGGDTLSQKKPDSMMLEYVCEKLGYSIEESVMVGDSKNDIIPANSLGMDSIAVTYGYNYDEDISIYSPTYIVDSFGDILRFL
jgi:phosphoglycolate phosphatase